MIKENTTEGGGVRKRVGQSMRARAVAARNIYAKAKARFLETHPTCQRCKFNLSDELHHMRGRAGTLLIDERYFMASCSGCHRWIHENPASAFKEGLLANSGDWNNPPYDSQTLKLYDQISELAAKIEANREKRKRARACKPKN